MATVRRRHRFDDGLIAAGSVCTVIAGISWMNPDVRANIANFLNGDQLAHASSVGAYFRALYHTWGYAVASYSADHRAMVGFVIAALVLFTLMFRT